jgi:hypothetical protein
MDLHEFTAHKQQVVTGLTIFLTSMTSLGLAFVFYSPLWRGLARLLNRGGELIGLSSPLTIKVYTRPKDQEWLELRSTVCNSLLALVALSDLRKSYFDNNIERLKVIRLDLKAMLTPQDELVSRPLIDEVDALLDTMIPTLEKHFLEWNDFARRITVAQREEKRKGAWIELAVARQRLPSIDWSQFGTPLPRVINVLEEAWNRQRDGIDEILLQHLSEEQAQDLNLSAKKPETLGRRIKGAPKKIGAKAARIWTGPARDLRDALRVDQYQFATDQSEERLPIAVRMQTHVEEPGNVQKSLIRRVFSFSFIVVVLTSFAVSTLVFLLRAPDLLPQAALDAIRQSSAALHHTRDLLDPRLTSPGMIISIAFMGLFGAATVFETVQGFRKHVWPRMQTWPVGVRVFVMASVVILAGVTAFVLHPEWLDNQSIQPLWAVLRPYIVGHALMHDIQWMGHGLWLFANKVFGSYISLGSLAVFIVFGYHFVLPRAIDYFHGTLDRLMITVERLIKFSRAILNRLMGVLDLLWILVIPDHRVRDFTPKAETKKNEELPKVPVSANHEVIEATHLFDRLYREYSLKIHKSTSAKDGELERLAIIWAFIQKQDIAKGVVSQFIGQVHSVQDQINALPRDVSIQGISGIEMSLTQLHRSYLDQKDILWSGYAEVVVNRLTTQLDSIKRNQRGPRQGPPSSGSRKIPDPAVAAAA